MRGYEAADLVESKGWPAKATVEAVGRPRTREAETGIRRRVPSMPSPQVHRRSPPVGGARRRVAFRRCRERCNPRPHDVGTPENSFRHSRARSRSTRRLSTYLYVSVIRHRTWKLCEPGPFQEISRRGVARSMNAGGGLSDCWTNLGSSCPSPIHALCGANVALKTRRLARAPVDQEGQARDWDGSPDPEAGSVFPQVKKMATL